MIAAPNLLGDAERGSSLNSFAFRRRINPLTAIPMQNEVRRLPNDQKGKN